MISWIKRKLEWRKVQRLKEFYAKGDCPACGNPFAKMNKKFLCPYIWCINSPFYLKDIYAGPEPEKTALEKIDEADKEARDEKYR